MKLNVTRTGHALGALALSALMSSALFAQPAQARTWLNLDETEGTVRGWQIGYSKGFAGCLAASRFTDGTTVWFGHSLKQSYFLAFTSENWQALKPGTNYRLVMQFPNLGKWNGSFLAFQHGDTKGVFLGKLKEEFMEQFAAGSALRLFASGTRMTGVRLDGTRAALGAVNRCKSERYDQAQRDLEEARRRNQQKARATPPQAQPPAPTAPPNKKRRPSGSSGTGFFVTTKGHIVTNNHVIKGCTSIKVGYSGGLLEKARLLAADPRNDLAVLKTDLTPEAVPTLAPRIRVGDDVYVYGFPLTGILSKTGNFTVGYVTSAAGLVDDTSQLQISAPIQPGNSGGPLVNARGNVVGVIVSKLNVLRVAKLIKDVPQNVNFAIKSSIVLSFLDANGITASAAAEPTEKMAPADIAERATKFTVRVICRRGQ